MPDVPWKPADTTAVVAQFERDLNQLSPEQRAWLERRRIPPRRIRVAAEAPSSVVAVAEVSGAVLYWSDIECGWEVANLSPAGAIAERGSSQFTLAQAVYEWQSQES